MMLKSFRLCAAATLALALVAVNAQAQVINLGTFIVDDDANAGDIPVVIPAGNWTSYTLTTDWSAIAGNPWSNEAIWALTDGPVGDPGTTFYADPGVAPNSAANGNSVTLEWNGFFDVPVSNPPLANAFFLSLQTFAGSTAEWANTVLTLGGGTIQPPATAASFDLTASTMGMNTLTHGPGDIAWYEIIHPGGELTLTTTFPETTLLGSFDPDNADTEIGLYSDTGALIASNDDEDFANDILTSLIVETLPAGTYYAATGGFNTTFGAAFGVTSTNTNTGDIKFAASVVPEPATGAMLALCSLCLFGFRRR